MKSISHIREADNHIQTVEEHLLEVKDLAEQYGEKIGVKHIAGLAGLLHDLGKYSQEFTTYIKQAVYDPLNAPKRGSIDHSSAGGKLLYDYLHDGIDKNVYQKALAEIVGNAIISHHSYLHDFISPNLDSPYLKRVKEKELIEFEDIKRKFFKKVMNKSDFESYTTQALKELQQYVADANVEEREAQFMFLSKYIFSVLIDADRTNTRQFIENESFNNSENPRLLFKQYYDSLMKRLDSYSKDSKANQTINILRTKMSEQCENFAQKESGIYTLSIPTGGGKTLASLRYALKHAELYNKERIIYIVPYTTIIEQNAADVKNVLGEDAFVLEHHSNTIHDTEMNEEDIYSTKTAKKTILAKDNWDTPIIFTTMVQFLNVFYAHSSRDVRRLHNLTNSILIFDEVQKVPIHCVSLFNRSLNFLTKVGNSSIILCTATQPALDFVNYKLDVKSDAEMIDNIDCVVKKFKRVNIIDKVTNKEFNQSDLISFIFENLNKVRNMLIVLNTKSVVKKLYKKLKEEFKGSIPIYHLSTSMCPEHRTDILNKIRAHLNQNERIICISTQLIEAGVDISFQSVIRSLAGLDSIAQAAGRCNRHGENERENVYVIDYIEENLSRLKEIETGKQIAKKMLKDIHIDKSAHGGSILSMQAMRFYFKSFYTEMKVDLDYTIPGLNQTMVQLLEAKRNENDYLNEYINRNREKELTLLVLNNSYRTAAKNFEVIDSPTTSIIVPYKKGKDIITRLNGENNISEISELFRESQRYSISVYPYQLDLLIDNDSVTTLLDNKVYALKDGAYDKEYGLNIQGDSSQEFLSI